MKLFVTALLGCDAYKGLSHAIRYKAKRYRLIWQ